MPRVVQIPLWDDVNFWEIEGEKLSKTLLPFIASLYTDGIISGLSSIGVAFDAAMYNTVAERFAATYTYELVKKINETSKAYLQETISAWIRSGEHLDKLTAQIMESGMFGEVRAEMIATTETTRAYAEGNLEGWRESGMVTGKRWMTAEDELVCEICGPLAGVVVGIDDLFNGEFDPPAHVNCLPGDSLVTPIGRIAAVSEREYSGDIIIIDTASHKHLACTPNHLILTRRGWVSARLLNVGGYVISGCIVDNPFLVDADNENVPTRIEDIADAFGRLPQMFTTPVPTTAIDFHADGRDGDVAIIKTDSLLWNEINPARSEQVAQRNFMLRLVRMGTLDPLSVQGFSSHAGYTPTAGDVAIPDLGGTLRCGHARPLHGFGFRLTPNVNVVFNQEAAGNTSAHSIEVRDSKLGHTTDVFLDEVVSVRKVHFSGHVYNLHTESSIYIADGILTHNCRCGIQPIVDTAAE